MPTPLVLESRVLMDLEPPFASDVEIVPLPIVAHTVPVPTLVDGRPT